MLYIRFFNYRNFQKHLTWFSVYFILAFTFPGTSDCGINPLRDRNQNEGAGGDQSFSEERGEFQMDAYGLEDGCMGREIFEGRSQPEVFSFSENFPSLTTVPLFRIFWRSYKTNTTYIQRSIFEKVDLDFRTNV